jgi:hypothetical protein
VGVDSAETGIDSGRRKSQLLDNEGEALGDPL